MFKKLFGMKGNATCTLNSLIKANNDGAKAYRCAADIVKDDEFKQVFLGHAETRARFAADLSAEVRKMGGEPATGGTLLGRIVIPLRMMWARMMGDETKRMISCAESAEDCAKNKYHQALKEELPEDAKRVLHMQAQGIEEAHDRIRNLEKSHVELPAGSEPQSQL
jgi:uncharacterized protein (TIGR02284 family)